MNTLEKQRISTSLPARADALTLYLSQIESFPLLSPVEEHDLAVRYYEHKDIEAAHRLVTSNLRFVVKIAMEYRHYRARLLDLIQEGNIGLMIAVKKFNPYKGYRLISYAVWWIRAYIHAFIMKTWSLVKIGTTQAQRRLFSEFSSSRSKDDNAHAVIAEKLNISEKEVLEAEMRMSHPDFSLDAELSDGSRTTHLDLIADNKPSQEETLVEKEEKNLIGKNLHKAIQKLHPREEFVLKHHLLAENPMTLQEIGEKLNITRERVRQIEEKTIAKLRQHLLTQ